jgi:Fe-S cluster biogenesis protein NfuA
MSEVGSRRRIRAQNSSKDPSVMGFVLDDPVQDGRDARFDTPNDAPLATALFALDGVRRVEVSDRTIWVRKDAEASWAALKPAIAAAIRQVMDTTERPLGDDPTPDQGREPDLHAAVEALLEKQINPSVAAHGGRIAVDRVDGATVYLRMSGGCQGCAASSATLRQGVERVLRAALPQITDIVDVTDHASGANPYYARSGGPSPVLNRPVPPDVIRLQDGQVTVDPDYLAPRLGVTPGQLREGLRTGDVVGVTEAGEGRDAGKTRIVLRSAHRSWAAEIDASGAAREIPPPRPAAKAAMMEKGLSERVRAHLESLSDAEIPITYGALARAMGLWMPGSIRRITRALETTMHEDAAAGRPFIAARVVSRGRNGRPGKGYFELAEALSKER